MIARAWRHWHLAYFGKFGTNLNLQFQNLQFLRRFQHLWKLLIWKLAVIWARIFSSFSRNDFPVYWTSLVVSSHYIAVLLPTALPLFCLALKTPLHPLTYSNWLVNLQGWKQRWHGLGGGCVGSGRPGLMLHWRVRQNEQPTPGPSGSYGATEHQHCQSWYRVQYACQVSMCGWGGKWQWFLRNSA